MTDKILERFEKVLIQVQKFDALFESENDLEVLRMACFEFAGLTYLKQGNLFILDQLVFEYRKTEVDYINHNIFHQDTLDLLKKYNLQEIMHCSEFKIEKKLYGSSLSKQIQDFSYCVKDRRYLEFLHQKFDTKTQIKTKFNYLRSVVFIYLDLMFFYRIDFKNKIEELNMDLIPKEQFQFYDAFHLGRPSLEKWIKFPTTDFLDFPEFQNKNIKTRIHKVQQRLFEKALHVEVQILLSKLAKGNRILNFKRFLDLCENFINGNLNPIDLKRLKVFFDFDREAEVLVELDNILMEKEVDYKKYLPFDSPNKRKSPRFTAELFMLFGSECSKKLKLYANKDAIIDLNDAKFTFTKKFIPKNKVNSFQFIHSTYNLNRFKSILNELNTKFNLIKLDSQAFDELLEVLTSPNYTNLIFKVHISCKTNLFAFILKELKPFFSNLTGKEIEESKMFLTKFNKKPLTASNFNKSGNSNIVEKDEIRRIINRK
jgi:hypothetical protein